MNMRMVECSLEHSISVLGMFKKATFDREVVLEVDRRRIFGSAENSSAHVGFAYNPPFVFKLVQATRR
jgi:hypothetical protein